MDVATFVCEDVTMDDAQARQDIEQAQRAYNDAQATADRARERLHEAIAEAQRSNVLRVRDLVELTGYGREHVRRIARTAGVSSSR